MSVFVKEHIFVIFIQFLTLKSGNERLQLIPVLMTMLKFSLDERETLVAIATGKFFTFICVLFLTSWLIGSLVLLVFVCVCVSSKMWNI